MSAAVTGWGGGPAQGVQQAGSAEQALAAGGVAVAFDGMRVPLVLLPVLPLLMPAVRAALADAGEPAGGGAEGSGGWRG